MPRKPPQPCASADLLTSLLRSIRPWSAPEVLPAPEGDPATVAAAARTTDPPGLPIAEIAPGRPEPILPAALSPSKTASSPRAPQPLSASSPERQGASASSLTAEIPDFLSGREEGQDCRRTPRCCQPLPWRKPSSPTSKGTPGRPSPAASSASSCTKAGIDASRRAIAAAFTAIAARPEVRVTRGANTYSYTWVGMRRCQVGAGLCPASKGRICLAMGRTLR